METDFNIFMISNGKGRWVCREVRGRIFLSFHWQGKGGREKELGQYFLKFSLAGEEGKGEGARAEVFPITPLLGWHPWTLLLRLWNRNFIGALGTCRWCKLWPNDAGNYWKQVKLPRGCNVIGCQCIPSGQHPCQLWIPLRATQHEQMLENANAKWGITVKGQILWLSF